MKRYFFGLLLFCISVHTQASVITMADPTIFYEDGYYYLTGTFRSGSGFNMYRSTDLVHWQAVGNATNNLAMWREDTFGDANFWAPQIFKHNGKYYLAYAANEQIGIAESSNPMGPYKQSRIHEITHTTGQIDPFLFRDDDGKVYLYYVRFVGGNTLYVARMKDDLSDIASDPVRCLGADDNTWEHTQNYSTTKVTEGPTVIKDGGYYYLLYSANHYLDIDYSVGYAYSKSPTGPWTKVKRPFLSRHNTGMNGSGHGDLFQAKDGQWYYVFHIHASNTNATGNRRTAIIPITLTDKPSNKFIPDPSRMIICDDAASTSATFPSEATTFEVDGIHYRPISGTNAMVTFGDAVLFNDYQGDLTIPSSVKNGTKSYRVTTIGSGAFHNCTRLTNVNLPFTITQISDYAFEGSAVRDITLPASCTKIGMRAFALCDKLRDVVVKAGTPSTITDDAFPATTYEKGKLWTPSNRGTSYSKASGWKNFRHISYVNEAAATCDACLDNCFYNILDNERCALAEESSFHYSYRDPLIRVKDTVVIDTKPYAVTKVAKSAMRESHFVEHVVMPSPIDTIDTYGFYNCYRLKKVELPATLSYIGGSAFGNCSALDSVVCHAVRPPHIASKTVFPTTAYNGVLLVPEGAGAAYETDAVWRNFLHIVEFGSSEIAPTHVTPPLRPASHIYTLDGKRLSNDEASLRPGIYVVDGKLKVKN